MSPNTPSVVNVSPVPHSPDLHQLESPLIEVTPFNVPQHVLPWSPLVPIGEHSQITRFALPLLSTPYKPLMREPLPEYPITSPSRGAPSTFMEPLSRMVHSRLETPCTPSRMQGPSTFREPYPVTQTPMAPATFVDSPDPQLIAGDSPLVAATQRFTLVEEEYLHTFRPTTSTASNPPPAPFHPILATPQQRLIYMPTWSAAQSGPLPLMPPTQAAPAATPVTPPTAPPQHFGYPPGGWGLMPNYYLATAQPYPIGYPLGPWPPYQQYYAGHPSHGDEDSETAKPNKFTGREPLKL